MPPTTWHDKERLLRPCSIMPTFARVTPLFQFRQQHMSPWTPPKHPYITSACYCSYWQTTSPQLNFPLSLPPRFLPSSCSSLSYAHSLSASFFRLTDKLYNPITALALVFFILTLQYHHGHIKNSQNPKQQWSRTNCSDSGNLPEETTQEIYTD